MQRTVKIYLGILLLLSLVAVPLGLLTFQPRTISLQYNEQIEGIDASNQWILDVLFDTDFPAMFNLTTIFSEPYFPSRDTLNYWRKQAFFPNDNLLLYSTYIIDVQFNLTITHTITTTQTINTSWLALTTYRRTHYVYWNNTDYITETFNQTTFRLPDQLRNQSLWQITAYFKRRNLYAHLGNGWLSGTPLWSYFLIYINANQHLVFVMAKTDATLLY